MSDMDALDPRAAVVAKAMAEYASSTPFMPAWAELAKVAVAALTPSPAVPPQAVTDAMVSDWKARLKTAQHVTGIPVQVDRVIAEMFAALQPQPPKEPE